jgi:tRNA G18 (ribose-2'-O)-methylase SpoU
VSLPTGSYTGDTGAGPQNEFATLNVATAAAVTLYALTR